MMRALLSACVVLAVFASVSAATIKEEQEGDGIATGDPCPLTGYKGFESTFEPPFIIPDASPAVMVGPPILIPDDGTTILDVIMDIDITHTWIGDLILTLHYDETCDGTPETSVTVLCLPGTLCAAAGPSCGADFGGLYLFSDAGAPFPESAIDCPTFVAPGCYTPDLDSGPMSVFDGSPKGGCFALFVEDTVAADVGSIAGWSIHLFNDTGVPVVPSTWGRVKARFGSSE